MNLNTLKEKFKHRCHVDLKDLDLALKAVPYLVREIEHLEAELRAAENRIEHLIAQMKRRPPLSVKGQKDQAAWEARVDEKKNRLYLQLRGRFDYRLAKTVSNRMLTVFSHLRPGFDVINDISSLAQDTDQRVLFHVRKIMYQLKELGIRKVIRVVNSECVQLAEIFDDKSRAVGYPAYKAGSVSEAEDMLDNIGRFLKA